MDAAVHFGDICEELFRGIERCEVGLKDARVIAACCGHLRCRLGAVGVVHRHSGASGRQVLSDGAPDAAAGARHKDGLLRKVDLHGMARQSCGSNEGGYSTGSIRKRPPSEASVSTYSRPSGPVRTSRMRPSSLSSSTSLWTTSSPSNTTRLIC